VGGASSPAMLFRLFARGWKPRPHELIPGMRWLYQERIRFPAVAGAVRAFLGVALLFVK